MSSNDELEATAEPVATGVEFYKAVNARNNHSGRGLAFDGGCLNLKKDGSGEFVFDRDAEIVSEEGKDLLIARIPASEIEFLRDYLAEAFPAARPVPAAELAPPARHDALREATDAMVEAACRAYWPAHWPRLFDKADLESIRGHMRRAIAAALAALPATAAEPVPPARQDALREALASHIATALDDIDVDTRGRCKWSEVATARDKIYRAVRSAALAPVPAPEAREGE